MAGVADHLAKYPGEVASARHEVRDLIAWLHPRECNDLGRLAIRVALTIRIRPARVGNRRLDISGHRVRSGYPIREHRQRHHQQEGGTA
jgi:hypothetical protein